MPPRTLLIMRHAKSSWKDGVQSDHDRPLNARGKRDAPRMGRLIGELGLVPDLIVSSTARRARKTAARVASNSGYDGDVRLEDAVYHASSEELVALLHTLDVEHRRVMIIGHNPGLEDLLAELTSAHEALPTAALARVDLALEEWADLRLPAEARLVALWRPREIED